MEINYWNQSPDPYISGDLFILCSNILILTGLPDTQRIELKTNCCHFYRANNKPPVIFVKTEILFEYIDFLLQLEHPYILITSCSDDICMPYIYSPCLNNDIKKKANMLLSSDLLVKWYTKNPCIIHSKIQPIPLGPKWQYHSHDFFGEDKVPIQKILNQFALEPTNNLLNMGLKHNLLYINFSITTTHDPFIREHTNIRRNVLNILENNGFQKNETKNFEEYMKEMMTYKFCASPPGRGLDTHRTWEALMMGTIPIINSSAMDPLFIDLPVIIVGDWNIVTPEFLETSYQEIHKRNETKPYDFSILYSNFWKDSINCSQ